MHTHGDWPCQDSGCPEWSRPSGPDRIRETIARDRGFYAPVRPVVLCGTADGTEKTVAAWDQERDREWDIPRWRLWARWRRQRACFHHDRLTGASWLGERLIDMGSGKMFWCRECGRTWFT